MIIVGKITDQLGAICRTRAVAAPGSSPGWRVKHDYTCEPLSLRSTQSAYMPITLGHDSSAIVGSVRHLDVGGHAGEIWAVADVHRELPDDVSLYFSIEYRGRDDAAELSAIGITTRPASIALPPLRMLEGTIRELPEATTLRLRRTEPHLARLLERARAATRSRRYDAPLVVENRHAPPPVSVTEYPDERPPGPIYHSAPYAGVISVR